MAPRFQIHAGFRIQGDELPEAQPSFPSTIVSKRHNNMAYTRSPFASISSSMFSPFGDKPVETHTGIDFPSEVCHKDKPCPTLTGLGVRAKRILGIKNVNVYALGIYVDPNAAKKALGSKFGKSSPEELASSQDFYDAVIQNASFEKSLRLVISFGHLRRGQFLDALEERLVPGLRREKEPESTLETFKCLFDDVTFKKGMEIVFVQEGGKLHTKVDGVQRAAIQSPALCRSLFDIYLGDDAVSPAAKTTFGENLASKVAAGTT